MTTKFLSQEKELFASVCKASRTINSSLEIAEILEALLDLAIQATGAERGAILLKEDADQKPPAFQIGKEIQAETLNSADFSVSMTVIRQVLETQEPILTDNVPKDFKASQSLRLGKVRSILCVPLLQSTGDPLGAIYLDSRASSTVFDKSDLQLVSALADQASVALHNAFLYHKLEKSYMGAVHCLARSIGYKDAYTLEHCQRVSEYSKKIAEVLGLDREMVREIEISALLHDVGKIGIEEAVLRKPGKLSDEEREMIEKHPAMGFEILAPLELSENVRLGILHHQERFDGKGYPDHLLGEEIPLIARIIAVADAWDAMTSDRAYRKALPRETALAEIQKNAGSQFDPLIVKAFLKVIGNP
jgi:putative nucleotidyltransferase with HDIG domain